ncbi:hypothetical protein [Escherichia phage dw-ec]|nr:hypothetical protein [Escherichia phage BI-EHEC]UJQ43825.1 hypothetical protein [Escherichia phage dw-ec]
MCRLYQHISKSLEVKLLIIREIFVS